MRLTLSAHCAEGVHGWAILCPKTSPRTRYRRHAALCRMLQQSELPERAKMSGAVCMADHYFAARAKARVHRAGRDVSDAGRSDFLCLLRRPWPSRLRNWRRNKSSSPICIGKARGNASDAPPPLAAQLLCGKPMQRGRGPVYAGCCRGRGGVGGQLWTDSELTARAFGYGFAAGCDITPRGCLWARARNRRRT